ADMHDEVVAAAVLLDVVQRNPRLDRLTDVATLRHDQGRVGPARKVAVSEASALSCLNQLAKRRGGPAASLRRGRAVQAEVARDKLLGRLPGRPMRHRDLGGARGAHPRANSFFVAALTHLQPPRLAMATGHLNERPLEP